MPTVVHWAKYYPPHRGGIESVTGSIARAAIRAGHHVKVVCFGNEHRPQHDVVAGVEVFRAPVQTIRASQPLSYSYFCQLAATARDADIVHLHAPNFLAALAVPLIGRRQKLVVHWHSDVINKGWIHSALKPLETAMLTRADRIVCTSHAYAQASASLRGLAHKTCVVPIGVPDPAAENSVHGIRPELNEQIAGRQIVLAVGRLVPYKGFRVLVDAASRLDTDAVVVIVGTGPLENELKERIRAKGLHDRVILAGPQSDDALRDLFLRASLFCLPSVERSEAFGVVLVEAMAHRLPVVATDIPGSGVPWVNQHGASGLNVAVDDPMALAAACNTILTSKDLRAKLADGARQRFEAEFTEGVSSGRILSIYSSLLVS